MKIVRTIALLAAAASLAACDAPKQNKTVDNFVDHKDLKDLKAGIWVDPTGCDQWMIDDGAEGYLSARLDKYGKPVCSGAAPPTYTVGPFKDGSEVPDPV
ncbi:MAG: hypothetical protein WCD16_09690 [Paracoccaceae bacterium]